MQHSNYSFDDKISIIIPIFNSELFLERTLSSLINQTWKNIEILCINNGSTDGSIEIINQYENYDSRILVYSIDKNNGPAPARNLGIRLASGKYIMFCDSDDWYEPEMCEKMITSLKLNNVDLVMCRTNIHHHDNYNHDLDNYITMFYDGYHILTDNDRTQINCLLWNKLFKKDIILNNEITFPIGYDHDDKAFTFAYLCCINKYFGLNLCLYNYFSRNNSLFNKSIDFTSSNKIFDLLYAFNHLKNILLNNNHLDNHLYFFLTSLNNDCRYFLWNKFNKNQKIEFLKLLKNIILNDLDLNHISGFNVFKLIKNNYFKLAYDIWEHKNYTQILLKIFNKFNSITDKIFT